MSKRNIGRVAIVLRGEYDPTAEYEVLDAVTYKGSCFILKRSCTGITPEPGDYYMLAASKGYTPIKGEDYFTSEDIRALISNIVNEGLFAEMEHSHSASDVKVTVTIGETQMEVLLSNYLADTILPMIQSRLLLSGGTMTGSINMGGNSITNLAAPTADADAATKKYVDNAISAAISSLELFPHADIPEYVKSEALSVAKKVAAKQAELSNQITFIAMSDTHYAGEQVDNWQEYSNISAQHAGMAAQIIAYSLGIDFACHLGDYTFGSANTTAELLKAQIEKVSQFLDGNFRGIPQFRAVGNHDTGEYSSLVGAEYLYQAIGSKCDDATFGSTVYGYCYRDFAEKKVRVICLNTSEGETDSGSSASEVVSAAQRLWFAQTLYDVGSKTDAADWSIIVLGHYSLDFGGAYPLSNIVYAYVNGSSITENGTTVNFSGNNGASFVADFHGHTHCFKVDSLYRVVSNVGTAYDAKKVCVPNASYYRNNYYGDTSFYGFTYSDSTTYDKTINTGKDTAFVVNVIDLDNKVIYSYCYGAGVDRVISCGSKVYHSINNTLSHVVTDNEATSIEDGAAYTATLTADTGYTLGTVTVTMGGTDITSTAYSDGGISIASVTGDIVITAVATKIVSYTNQVPISTDADGNVYNGTGYKDGYRINSSGAEAELSGFTATGFIPFTKGQTIRIGGEGITYAEYGCMVMFYDLNKVVLTDKGINYDKVGDTTYGTWSTENNSVFCLDPLDAYPNTLSGINGYIRISAKGSGANLIVTLDEKIE